MAKAAKVAETRPLKIVNWPRSFAYLSAFVRLRRDQKMGILQLVELYRNTVIELAVYILR